MTKKTIAASVLLIGLAPAAGHAETDQSAPNAIDYAMYFNADVRDAPNCAMSVVNGAVIIDPAIRNPAMTCPDMFSWKLFTEVVSQEFWKNWAADEQTWPSQPYAKCSPSNDTKPCCDPTSHDNPGYDHAENPAIHCPYFPGDHRAAGTTPPLPVAQPLSKAHSTHFDGNLRPVTPQDINAIDPGRIIRQSMAEFVFRNKPMFDYIFENDLYNADGLAKVFAENAKVMSSNAPFHSANAGGASARIDFPVDAVMIKSNWISRARAEEIGIKNNPDNPFITMEVKSAVTDNNAQIFEPGEHWLLSFHVSSKDIPNWVWLTFEHVDNFGRCDYTGCNDSYGFASPDTVQEGAADNFTRPHVMSDDLPIASPIFDPGLLYASGPIRPGLEGVLDGLDIGTSEAVDPAMPSAADAAWRSYRLKGSQVDFVQSTGHRILLGNSVTEGGFMMSSSCMTCHARAHVGADGKPSVLGVFENTVDSIGYGESSNGIPNPAWFISSQQPPALQALQTDFVWGFFFANDVVKADD
ncbi:MAG: hypothetical protein JJU21_12655 [Salinarimonas sp.]|nr:hypothetical protein [Salinarimonas sp.]